MFILALSGLRWLYQLAKSATEMKSCKPLRTFWPGSACSTFVCPYACGCKHWTWPVSPTLGPRHSKMPVTQNMQLKFHCGCFLCHIRYQRTLTAIRWYESFTSFRLGSSIYFGALLPVRLWHWVQLEESTSDENCPHNHCKAKAFSCQCYVYVKT